jgi:hypothetical protein
VKIRACVVSIAVQFQTTTGKNRNRSNLDNSQHESDEREHSWGGYALAGPVRVTAERPCAALR